MYKFQYLTKIISSKAKAHCIVLVVCKAVLMLIPQISISEYFAVLKN